MNFLPCWLLLLGYAVPSLAATPEDWRSRAIYQVVTDRFAVDDGSTNTPCNPGLGRYCGGTYQGLIKRLDYIQNMGFSAIWISPITKQLPQHTVDLDAYHGYWQQDIYQLNEHFGDPDDLKALSKALHDRGMYLMVDIVVNHYGWAGPGPTTNFTELSPFNDERYFHTYCPFSEPDNQTNVEECWLGDEVISLPDLRTEDDDVVDIYYDWIKSLVSNYSVDGLRVDTVLNVDKQFFPGFSNAAGVFLTGEVTSGVSDYTCPYQQIIDSVLNYPIYWPLTRAFTSPDGSITDLLEEIYADPTLLGSFSENHDVPRFPSHTSDLSLAKNVIAYTMLTDGIPIIYAGQEQHYSGAFNPVNREAVWSSGYNTDSELYKFVTTLNTIRNYAIRQATNYTIYLSTPVFNDTNTLALRKGFDGTQSLLVLSNLGSQGKHYSVTLGDTFQAHEQVTELIGCSNATTDGHGGLAVQMGGGLPKMYYPSSLLKDSGLCGFLGKAAKPTAPPPSTPTHGPVAPKPHHKSSANSLVEMIPRHHICIVFLFTLLIRGIIDFSSGK
ncbi:glycoside hydrolase family 13 protein [Xylona heveae TC161]|uniref:alpha-amylase n=1 Tax=Xylona heveae (strain CBS 132557 / TC161) TaxID=1328760 RepID=A0A165H1I8_XYLHT|nr:glycoside hydrolase family 13 protein [Xylona heveae TC161]KZF22866.1 glycoside hydrolase family 13 protein [Xylona heveae TC161]